MKTKYEFQFEIAHNGGSAYARCCGYMNLNNLDDQYWDNTQYCDIKIDEVEIIASSLKEVEEILYSLPDWEEWDKIAEAMN